MYIPPSLAIITICIPWAHLWRILEPLPLDRVLRLLPPPLLRVRAALLHPPTGRSVGLVLKFPAPLSLFAVGDPPRVPCRKKMATFLLPERAGCCCLHSGLATCWSLCAWPVMPIVHSLRMPAFPSLAHACV